LRALKSQFPRFRISILVEQRFADCFRNNPDVTEIIAVRNKAATIMRGLPRRFDVIVNLHGGPTSLLYALSARGPAVGGEQYPHRWLYRGTFPRPDPEQHTAQSTLNTFRWLGVSAVTAPPLRVERDDLAAARVEQMLKRGRPNEGPDAGTYVVVHPAAVMVTKRWPVDRFAALVQWLQDRGMRVVLTSGPGEEALLTTIQQAVSGVTALPGLGIPELAELIRGAQLYVGNDSGPMHLATAVGTSTVAIWGSSSSVRWHPWGVAHRVVQNPFACNPCPGYRCLVASSPLCIESVTVEQVESAIRDIAGQSINR
jgi:heptosyltransferase-3